MLMDGFMFSCKTQTYLIYQLLNNERISRAQNLCPYYHAPDRLTFLFTHKLQYGKALVKEMHTLHSVPLVIKCVVFSIHFTSFHVRYN